MAISSSRRRRERTVRNCRILDPEKGGGVRSTQNQHFYHATQKHPAAFPAAEIFPNLGGLAPGPPPKGRISTDASSEMAILASRKGRKGAKPRSASKEMAILASREVKTDRRLERNGYLGSTRGPRTRDAPSEMAILVGEVEVIIIV